MTDPELEDEVLVLNEFRRLHAEPLSQVSAGLRYFVRKHTLKPPFVAQRLKRELTIIQKLGQFETMQLGRFQDIGGCRAVVETEAEARAIADDLLHQRRWDIKRPIKDYIQNPNPVTGYRGLHLIVTKQGRQIEVQIRTNGQNDWAQFVESWDKKISVPPALDLKRGVAPVLVLEYFRLGADIIALRESGSVVPAPMQARFRNLHGKATSTLDKLAAIVDKGSGAK